MSLSNTLMSATSGLMAAQAGLRTVSDNIANINTPGYVRKTLDQQQMVVNGVGMGVQIAGVKRVTDQYLQMASLTSASDSGRLNVLSQYLDNAQSLYGDPSSDTFFFNRLDKVYAGFSAVTNDPSNSLLRSQALSNVQDFLNETARINTQISNLGKTMETRISADVDRANDLLAQIDRLNADISRIKVSQGDASGSENIQSGLLDELASLMNVQVAQRSEGGVVVRTAEGVALTGQGAATLIYNQTDGTPGYISVRAPGSAGAPQPIKITSGEIRGLMDLRDVSLPKMADQLGEFVSRAVDQLNAAHNASSAFPAPTTLTGRDTGMDLPTAVTNFSGQTTVAITNAAGVIQARVAIDFTAGTMNNGGGAVAFTPASFLAVLNGQLGGSGSASFSNGALSITAAGANGVAVDEGTSAKAGRAFSAFFGLNDLIRPDAITNYETGLLPGDAHGFVAGEQITLHLAQPDGKPIRDVTVTIPGAPATSMTDLLAALNSSSAGVGLYGQFTLNADGAITFAGSAPTNATLSVVTDNTHHGAGGPSFSELFGVGVKARSARAGLFKIDQALMSDPARLAMGKLDLSVAAGQPAIRAGDGAGALAIAASGDRVVNFRAAGSLGDVAMTVSRYASEFGGSIGREAAAVETQALSAMAIRTEADARRESIEGVNLDEELVRLTTYQQAFNASARMIQASKDLFDILTQML